MTRRSSTSSSTTRTVSASSVDLWFSVVMAGSRQERLNLLHHRAQVIGLADESVRNTANAASGFAAGGDDHLQTGITLAHEAGELKAVHPAAHMDIREE